MTEREAREKAAIRILIEGLPGSHDGGPVMRLLEKRRLILERWEQRKVRRAKAYEKPDEPPAA